MTGPPLSLLDTLASIAGGRPTVVRAQPPAGPTAGGEYRSRKLGTPGDSIFIDPSGNKLNAPDDYVLMHEMGHRLFEQSDPNRPAQFRPDGVRDPQLVEIARQMRAESSGAGDIASERFAESFGNAMSSMRGTAQHPAFHDPRADQNDEGPLVAWLGTRPEFATRARTQIESTRQAPDASQVAFASTQTSPSMPIPLGERPPLKVEASDPVRPTTQPPAAPNVELELAKLANDAMAGGADPHDVTGKLHQTISYLRQFPHMAEHANNALADGVASPADVSRTLWPHVSAMSHANGAPGASNAPTPEESAALPPDAGGARSRLGGGLAAFASGTPGGESFVTGVHAIVNGQPYREAYRDVKAAEHSSPIEGALRFAGAIPAAMAAPGGPVAGGALLGGADEALNADPNESLTERGARTAIGTGAGAFLGKTLQKVGTVGKALLPIPLGGTGGADANLIARKAARALSAGRLYNAAMNEGRGQAVTPAIQQFLGEDDIAPIVERIQAGRTGKTLDTPELLDRVYKELSDMQRSAGKPLASVDPSKPNLAVSRLADIKAAKGQALSAISGTASQPGPMPSYQQAVEDYAQRTQEIDALKRGYETLQKKMSSRLPTVNNLGRKTPLAFEEWAKTATPEQLAAARQGILGGVRDATALPGKTFAPLRKAVSAAGPLERVTQPPNQEWLDALRNLGIVDAGNTTNQRLSSP